jgi:hypothetical protein
MIPIITVQGVIDPVSCCASPCFEMRHSRISSAKHGCDRLASSNFRRARSDAAATCSLPPPDQRVVAVPTRVCSSALNRKAATEPLCRTIVNSNASDVWIQFRLSH